MKLKLNKNQTKKDNSKTKDFDALVQELQEITNYGCCSDQNSCNLRCSPINGGCNNNKNDGSC